MSMLEDVVLSLVARSPCNTEVCDNTIAVAELSVGDISSWDDFSKGLCFSVTLVECSLLGFEYGTISILRREVMIFLNALDGTDDAEVGVAFSGL